MKLGLKLILFVVCQMANAFDEEPLPTFALPIEVISEKIIEQETLAPEVPIEVIEITEVDIDGVLEKGSLPAEVPEKVIEEEVVTEVAMIGFPP